MTDGRHSRRSSASPSGRRFSEAPAAPEHWPRQLAEIAEAVARPAAAATTPPLPDGKYRVIYADPPWRFETFSARGLDRGAENHYPTMDRAAIEALPVGGLAADDCCLFLWAVGPMLPEAFAVMMAWGFEFKSVAFVWAKAGARLAAERAERGDYRGEEFPIGLGYWTRQQAELCLLATRGSPKPQARNVPQLIVAPRREHSRKPDEAYDRIERLAAGPYLELFARRPRDGWSAWGDEVKA